MTRTTAREYLSEFLLSRMQKIQYPVVVAPTEVELWLWGTICFFLDVNFRANWKLVWTNPMSRSPPHAKGWFASRWISNGSYVTALWRLISVYFCLFTRCLADSFSYVVRLIADCRHEQFVMWINNVRSCCKLILDRCTPTTAKTQTRVGNKGNAAIVVDNWTITLDVKRHTKKTSWLHTTCSMSSWTVIYCKFKSARFSLEWSFQRSLNASRIQTSLVALPIYAYLHLQLSPLEKCIWDNFHIFKRQNQKHNLNSMRSDIVFWHVNLRLLALDIRLFIDSSGFWINILRA